MIILLIFCALAATALFGFVMTTATDKTIAIFNKHGLFISWSDTKVHGVGVLIMIICVVIMFAIISTVIKARRKS